ncbi:alpha/beta fold hydrolase [Desulfoluna sp.]|uniref:alpha/beta fold hydrolase n=1 Tax=Desulfoluna sp. TaxID=2045199 RepID=UPI00260E4594|nr:alpha/beta fold hydrolase [Desulfoluna sp.]
MITSRINGFGFLAGQAQPDPKQKNLLFIHGAGQNSHFWSHQVKGLAPHVNTFALDLPGHHRSDGPLHTTVPDMAQAVLNFMDAAGLPSVIPCGLSMGGAIVLQLLLDHPTRFPEAILANTGARLRVLPDILEAVQTNYPAYLKAMFHFAIPPAKRTPRVEDILSAATEKNNDPALADLKACDIFDVMPRLSEIQSRVLVITAEKDISTPLKYGRLLSDKIVNASLIMIQGCGHFSPIESPEEFNEKIVAFF